MPQDILKLLLSGYGNGVVVEGGAVRIANPAVLASPATDVLAVKSALGSAEEKPMARWLIWELAQAAGVYPSSIHELYTARGRGETTRNWTTPAMNLRAMAYDSARAVFRAASKLHVGAMIFEIARSEIGYTDQRPSEYTASILAAALREGYHGPVFIQGDHFQVNAKKYAANAQGELQAVKDLIVEAIQAGFLNIDIDSSTLVDLKYDTIDQQQQTNYRLCAELTHFIRQHQPSDVQVSVGGEIGEVGGKNSTEEELRAFMDGYLRTLAQVDGVQAGISKISVQTGTSHGGVVLPDGSIAQVKVDFDTLARLSRVAHEDYHLGGAVQHGASTLPENAFFKFAQAEAVEVHLATGFQNMMYDLVPDELRAEIYGWLDTNAADERKPSDTAEQFYYKTRKKAIGPFKKQLWGLDEVTRETIGQRWEQQFAFLFEQLGVANTADLVANCVTVVKLPRSPSDFGVPQAVAEDVSGLAD